MSGGESRDLQIFNSTTATFDWSLACDTTAAIGNHSAAGYRAYTATVGSATGLAKAIIELGSTPYIYNANTSTRISQFNLTTAQVSSRAFFRFAFKVVTLPGDLTYVHRVFRIGNSGLTAVAWEMQVNGTSGGSVGRVDINCGGTLTLFTPTVGTAYRMEVELIKTSAHVWTANTKVYTLTGTTILAELSQSTGSSAVDALYALYLGCVPTFGKGPFEFHIDDIAVNNELAGTSGTGVNVGSPGTGTSYREQDWSAGTYSEWTASAGTAIACVETSTTFLNEDDTDYIKSTNSANMRHSFTMPDYPTGGTWGTVRALCILVRHTTDAAANDDVFHRCGVYDGTNLHLATAGMSGTSAMVPEYVIVDEKYSSGGALTNTYFNSCEPVVQRYSDLSGLNLKRVAYLLVEVEDDEGGTPPAVGVARAGVGSVV